MLVYSSIGCSNLTSKSAWKRNWSTLRKFLNVCLCGADFLTRKSTMRKTTAWLDKRQMYRGQRYLLFVNIFAARPEVVHIINLNASCVFSGRRRSLRFFRFQKDYLNKCLKLSVEQFLKLFLFHLVEEFLITPSFLRWQSKHLKIIVRTVLRILKDRHLSIFNTKYHFTSIFLHVPYQIH